MYMYCDPETYRRDLLKYLYILVDLLHQSVLHYGKLQMHEGKVKAMKETGIRLNKATLPENAIEKSFKLQLKDVNINPVQAVNPSRNHSVIRQPYAFKSERPRISKPRESSPAKPHHVNAPSSSRNCQKESNQGFKEVKCDEQEQMATADNTSGLAPQRKESLKPEPILMTPGQISLGLVPNPVPAAPYVPPNNTDLEILCQPMFDEYFEPPSVERPVLPAHAVQVPVVLASTPSSITIDQDAPSTSHSPSSSEVQAHILHQCVAVGPTFKDNPFAQANNDPFVNVFVLEPSSEDSSSRDTEADDQAIQTILLGLPEDIYAPVDSCETAQEIWLRVQQMMKGSDIRIQEKKAKLFNEWEKLTSTDDGESIESYYHRFLKLMNDLKRNKHFPEKIASNLKFLNNLQPEWSRHVTIVHQIKDLHTTDYTQLYDFLKYNQKENVRNLNGYNDVQNVGNQVIQNAVQNPRNQNGQIVVSRHANQNLNGNGNLVAARAESNANGHNGNQIRCYNCRGLGIQLQAEEFDLMAAAADLDEIEEVNANCILMANLQQASTLGTQTDKAPVYDSDGSAEVSDQKDITCDKSANTKFAKQSILEKPPKVGKTYALSKPVTSNSIPTPQESKVVKNDKVISPGMFRINPFKPSREEKHVPNNVRASTTLRPEGHSLRAIQRMIGSSLRLGVVESRGKNQKANVSIKEKQKKQNPKVKKPKKVGFIERLATPKPSKPRSFLRWSPTGRMFYLKGKIIASNESESQSDCSKGDNAYTSNPLEPTIKRFPNSTFFGRNDHVAAILGFSDLQWGNILITRVYFVEGLEGVDLLKRNRSTNLYTINLHEMASASPICLMARASSTKLWLWHQRLSYLNFDTINDLAKNDLVSGLPKFKYHKEHLFPSCEQGKSKRASYPLKPVPNLRQRLHLLHMDLCGPMRIASINGKWYVLVIVDDYSRYTWVDFLRSKDEALEVIKIFLKRIIILQKPDISFFHVFGALCYPKNDREDIGKLGAKGYIGFFICYSADSCAYRVFNRRTKKIMETMNVSFNELSAMAFEQRSSKPRLQSMTFGQISLGLDLTYASSTITSKLPTEGELELLFEAMYDDYIGVQPSSAQRTNLATQAHQVRQTLTTSTLIADSASTPTNSSSQATNFLNTSQDVDELNLQQQHAQQQGNQALIQPETIADNVLNAMFDANTFVNPFATSSTSAAESSSSQYVDPSNMHTFYQPYPYEFQWTKDHPLEQNVKEAMTDPALIESMQKKLLQFKRLDVWILVLAPDNITPLTLKWLFKNKHDEEKMVIRNKSHLVMRGYRQEEGIDFKESFAPALYGLKQAPRAWYGELLTFLLQNHFFKGTIDPTLFIRRFVNDILVSFYVLEILKKYGMESCDPVGTSMEIKDKLDLDQNETPVDATKYHSMIGALMYLTSSRPNIVHATCLCARYQAKPTEKHLKEVKSIFHYLCGTVNTSLWYTKDYGFELTGFLDADYAGCKHTFKSTSGGAQFLALAISCNPVQHSRTKHIAVRYHFIKEHVEKGSIELYFVKTDYQLTDLFTKALPVDRFNHLVRRLAMRSLSPQELDHLAKSHQSQRDLPSNTPLDRVEVLVMNGNPSRVSIKQLCDRIRRGRYNLIPADSRFKTSCSNQQRFIQDESLIYQSLPQIYDVQALPQKNMFNKIAGQ
nr:hypothetical protein [Tanacetum cinerariifolium]